MLGFKHPDVA